MTQNLLKHAIQKIDWKSNIDSFFTHDSIVTNIEQANMRIAVWSKQIENIDKGNPALSFIREMQSAGHQIALLITLSLYKPAASLMRTAFETALYYTYFRTHPTELASLVRNPKYYITKSDLLEYHKTHTPDFTTSSQAFNLTKTINSWYHDISSIIHGQIPGRWTQRHSLSDLSIDEALLKEAADNFLLCEKIIHQLFLCTIGKSNWNDLSIDSKRRLSSGLPSKTKVALGISKA